MGGGPTKSTTTQTPTAPQIPAELQPLVNMAVNSMTGTQPYVPLQMFAQPFQQQIPDLSKGQQTLISQIANLPNQSWLMSPYQDAMNLTRGAIGMGPSRNAGPAPFQMSDTDLFGFPKSYPSLPTGYQLPPQPPNLSPPPPPTPGGPPAPPPGPAGGLPPGYTVDPNTGTIIPPGPPPPYPGGGGP